MADDKKTKDDTDDKEVGKTPEKSKTKVEFKPELEEAISELLMGITEDREEHSDIIQMFVEALDMSQRNRRRMIFKQYRAKILQARKKAEARTAGTDVLKKRARRMAIQKIKQKVLKSVPLDQASVAEKNRAEAAVKRKKDQILRLTNSFLKDVRANQAKRMNADSKNESVENLVASFNELYENINNK